MVVRVEEILEQPKMDKSKAKKRKSNGMSVSEGGSPSRSSSDNPTPVPIMDGMSSAEVMMIRRLAGNDPAVRKKMVRKLKKWLIAIANKTSDTPESRSGIEPNLIRVWKALFYCMWMADKPLPQEQLSEHISDLISIFQSKPNALLLFIEWFFRTMAREWSWIDRLRLDKFMQLVRRFLRKSFIAMATQKWKAETTDGFLKIIRMFIFNHHPTKTGGNKGKRASIGGQISKQLPEPTINCPVGFQIHFIDIYLEELAKVDADGLTSPKTLKLLSPFIKELTTNDDTRVLDEIRERVFHHLMRQSDVGMDYQEELAGIEMSDEDDEEMDKDEGVEEDLENSEDQDKDELEDEEMEENNMSNGPLDPRAGAVDVVLPQLPIDYATLAEKLAEAGGNKTVKKKNRGLLYTLASQFREIVQGKYPLALPEAEPHKPAIPKKELVKATKRLIELETAQTPKIRKNKRQRKREAQRAAAAEAAKQELNETVCSEDTSMFLNDDELLDHVSDNYVSYIHEQVENDTSSQENGVDEKDANSEAPKSKKKKQKKPKYKTVIEVEADELDGMEELKETESVAVDSKPMEGESVVLIRPRKSSLMKKAKKMKIQSEGDSPSSNDSPLKKIKKTPMKAKEREEEAILTPLKLMKFMKSKKKSESPPKLVPVTPINKKLKGIGYSTPTSTPTSSAKKRVSFVLAKNSEHEATDYMGSISKSPAIPFDSDRTPTNGLLKINPIKKPMRLSLAPTPRKTALDFFAELENFSFP